MPSDFEDAARERRRSLVGELAAFLAETRAYWLVPLIVVLLIVALVVAAGATPLGPMIYALF
jgi:hypothetical protein